MKGLKLVLVNFSSVAFEILREDYDWHWIDCEQMPDCDCGEMHLVPPLEEMVGTLEDGEAEAFHIDEIDTRTGREGRRLPRSFWICSKAGRTSSGLSKVGAGEHAMTSREVYPPPPLSVHPLYTC